MASVSFAATNSQYNNTNAATHLNDDTEGGLHWPLGASSPIMRKACLAATSMFLNRPPLTDTSSMQEGDTSNKHLKRRSLADANTTTTLTSDSTTSSPPHQPTRNKTAEELHAIRMWQHDCREKQLNAYEEMNANIRGILHGRKREAVERRNAAIQQERQAEAADASASTRRSADTTTGTNAFNDSSDHTSFVEEFNTIYNNHVEAFDLAKQHRSWLQKDGRLVVLKSLPHMSLQGVVVHPLKCEAGMNVITLSPGCTVYAEETFVLDSFTLRGTYPPQRSTRSTVDNKSQTDQTHANTIQLLRISSPHCGYIVSHLHNYPFVSPGSASVVTASVLDDSNWMWRVMYEPDGAFVREGCELGSDHIGTLPYGTIVNVQSKAVNEMGLSRLRIDAYVADAPFDHGRHSNDDAFCMKKVSGWISEFLNPLSGARGNIVEPIPFAVPLLYKVVLDDGAVIFSGVEISSLQIGLAPKGSLLSVVGRAFTDSSVRCMEKLRLAGGGGWISVQLDHHGREQVVELVGVDPSFEADDPAAFHFKEQKKVMAELNANSRGSGGHRVSISTSSSRGARYFYQRQLSEINDDETIEEQSLESDSDEEENKPQSLLAATLYRSGASKLFSDQHQQNRCLICLTDERNATIVHGETGHIVCCLTCARILNARKDK
jgi:hypothetical protein